MPKGVKQHDESDPVYEKREKVTYDENIHIYNGFSTSDHRFSTPFLSRSVMKSNLKTDAEFNCLKPLENEPSAPKQTQRGCQNRSKIDENPTLGPQVPSSVTLGTPRSQKH